MLDISKSRVISWLAGKGAGNCGGMSGVKEVHPGHLAGKDEVHPGHLL